MRSSRVTIAATAAILVTFTPVMAQTVADFYRGKTVQLLVGYPPGGGFDVYARAVGRFMGKHIPGNPTVIINNMPGASSLQLIRYLLTVAPTDGTQFGMFNRGLMQQSMLNPEKIDVDFTRFTWIGSMNSELNVCYIWGTKGIDTIERMKKASITLGETSQNSAGYIYTAILRSLTPDNVRPVYGYRSTGDIWLAMERGEVDGNCTLMSSLQTQRPEWLIHKKIDFLVQFAKERHKNLPNVPTIFELISSKNAQKAIDFLIASEPIGRPIVGPPNMAPERAIALRKAFLDTMKDPEFLLFAANAKMDLEPVAGEKASEIAAETQNTPSDVVDFARKLLR